MTNSEMMLDRLISTAEADRNLCAAAFEVIANAPAEERGSLLQQFLTGYHVTPSSQTLELPEVVTSQDVLRFARRYGRIADNAMLALMNQELPENVFYDRLWEYICTTDELPDDQLSRICTLYNFAVDRRLPYYRLNMDSTVTMTEDAFEQAMDRIGTESLSKMRHILCCDFSQKTQEASLLLDLLDDLPDRETRAVFLVQILGALRQDALRRESRREDIHRLLDSLPDLPAGGDDDSDDAETGDSADFDSLQVQALNALLGTTGSAEDSADHDCSRFTVGLDFGPSCFYPDILDPDDFVEADDGDPNGDPTIFPAEDPE